jgi:hypothetical protein
VRNHRQTLLGLFLGCLATPAAAWAQPAATQPSSPAPAGAALRAEVRAVSVLDPGLVAAFEQAGGFSLGQPGTALGIVVQSPAGGLVAFDENESKLTSFRDDKGRDLTVPPKDLRDQGGGPARFNLPREARFSPFASFSRDGKLALVQLSAPVAPTSGAVKLSLRATLRLTLAAGQERVELKNVALRKGPVEAKGLQVEIEDAGPPQMGFDDGRNFAIKLKTQGETTARLASIEFLDAEGRSIESRSAGHMQMNDERTTEYTFAEAVPTATIRLNLWKDLKSVDVPLDTAVTLGVTPAGAGSPSD